MKPLAVQARSTLPISRDEYGQLESSLDFGRLVDEGIVSLIRTKKSGYAVKAGPHVGTAVVGNFRLNVLEKEPNSISGLLPWSVPDEFRGIDVVSTISKNANVLEQLFLKDFLGRVGLYLSRGKTKKYVLSNEVSDRPRGKINVRQTLNLRARGHQGRLAVDVSRISPDVTENQLIAYALKRVSDALSLMGGPAQMQLARQYAALFQGTSISAIANIPTWKREAAIAEALGNRTLSPELRAALAYAQPYIVSSGFGDNGGDDRLPKAYFINLETLFEVAVLAVLRSQAAPLGYITGKGREFSPSIFPTGPASYIADPDFLVRSGENFALVGDVKYKSLDGNPEHSDVYQILTHASTVRATQAVLVYPGEEQSLRLIGIHDNRISLWASTVRPSFIADDLRELWRLVSS